MISGETQCKTHSVLHSRNAEGPEETFSRGQDGKAVFQREGGPLQLPVRPSKSSKMSAGMALPTCPTEFGQFAGQEEITLRKFAGRIRALNLPCKCIFKLSSSRISESIGNTGRVHTSLCVWAVLIKLRHFRRNGRIRKMPPKDLFKISLKSISKGFFVVIVLAVEGGSSRE